MMDAIVSGRAGKAILLDGNSLFSVEVGAPDKLVPRQEWELRLLLGDARDIQIFENIDQKSVADKLSFASDSVYALDLALITLDAELPEDVRKEAADELNLLLHDKKLIKRLESILYASPLPDNGDIKGVLTYSSGATQTLFQNLAACQSTIREVWQAFLLIPEKFFGDSEAKEAFRRIAVDGGMFRDLVILLEQGKGVANFLVTHLSVQPRYRTALQEWVKPFHEQFQRGAISREIEETVTSKKPARHENRHRKKKKVPAEERLKKVESQKQLVVQWLQRHDLRRARDIVKELVAHQLENGGPKYAAMSLCDLAVEAQQRGYYSFQLELTEQSISLVPDDGVAWTQKGEALLELSRPVEAFEAYEQAIRFRRNPISLCGRANVLKSLGKLEAALQAYNEVIADFPNDVVARNGRAEVLKAQGELTAALQAYNEVIADFPNDVVAKYARTCVLTELGRYEEALVGLPDSVVVTYQDWIGYHVRGMIYLRMGKIDEAAWVLEQGVADAPWPSQKEFFRNAFAAVCLRRKDYAMAISYLEQVSFPYIQTYTDVLKLHSYGELGEITQASEAYERVKKSPAAPKELTEELHWRYIVQEEPRHDDDWLFTNEINLLISSVSPQAMSAFVC